MDSLGGVEEARTRASGYWDIEILGYGLVRVAHVRSMGRHLFIYLFISSYADRGL
jgi:hypothetical protein